MLKGELINLRLIDQDDLAEVYTLTSDLAERGPYWSVTLKSFEELRKRYTETAFWNENSGKMLIMDKTGRIVGEIFYAKTTHYMAGYEIGYQLYKKADRGKGYVSEALKLFSNYLFALKPINRLEINVIPDNLSSRRVAEKCGFKYEGVKRQVVFNRGRYKDMESFSLLREEVSNLFE